MSPFRYLNCIALSAPRLLACLACPLGFCAVCGLIGGQQFDLGGVKVAVGKTERNCSWLLA